LDDKPDETQPEKNFVSKLFESLKALGFESMFGLHRLHHRSDLDGFESTVQKERANITKFMPASPDKDYIDVVWTFTKCENCDDCKRKVPVKCMKHCNQHCKGHTK
jgi:hypothetical protein